MPGLDDGLDVRGEPDLGDYQRFVQPHWSDEEVATLAVVAGFVHLLRTHAFDELLDLYRDHPYRQHNVGMADGVHGVVEAGRSLAKRFPAFAIDTKRVHVDGDTVIIHSHMITTSRHVGDDRRGLNVIDVWTVSGGRIVEHWDSIQPIGVGFRLLSLLMGGRVRSGNGRF